MQKRALWYLLILLCGIMAPSYAYTNMHVDGDFTPAIYLWLALSILMSRSLAIVKKIGLPLVTSEIFAGIILGHLDFFGIYTFNGMEKNQIVKFLAEVGAMILMFEIGLETQVEDIGTKLRSGTIIALSGSIFTFFGGYFATAIIYPASTYKSQMLI